MVFLLVIVSVCERVCVPTRPRKGVFVSDCVCDCLCERVCVPTTPRNAVFVLVSTTVFTFRPWYL